jgi:hypothetical protein
MVTVSSEIESAPVRDSHKGPLNNQEKPTSFHKKRKRKRIRDPKSRTNTIATPVASTAHLNTRPSHPLTSLEG